MGTRVGSGVSGGHCHDANRAGAPMSPGFPPPGGRCAGRAGGAGAGRAARGRRACPVRCSSRHYALFGGETVAAVGVAERRGLWHSG